MALTSADLGMNITVSEWVSMYEALITYNLRFGHLSGSPYQGPISPPSPNFGATNLGHPLPPSAGYQNSPYQQSAHGADLYRAPSPFRGVPASHPEQAILSRSRAPSPIPGAVPPYGSRSRAPSPIPGGVSAQGPYPPRPRSRAASPLPGTAPPPYSGQSGFPGQYSNALPRSPHVGGGAVLGGADHPPPMLPPPDGFSRPANLAQSYTFFETMKIQDMDDFYDNMPRMPKVLVPHDVYHEDWIRFIQVGRLFLFSARYSVWVQLLTISLKDLAMAWAGKLPTTDPNRASRPSVVGAELIDLWNNSFFAARGVEAVLFKGHERRSGPWIGQIERNLPGFRDDSDSDSSDSLSSSDSSGRSDNKYGRGAAAGGGYYGSYGDSKRRKAERKAEKKRKNKEKKARRRARERERSYALYISCIAPRDGALGASY